MKLAGIVFLFFSVSLFGFEIGNRYISLLKDIERAEVFLKNIMLCLENENMTVGEIFENCGNFCDKKTNDFVSALQSRESETVSETALKCGFCKNKAVFPVLEETFSVLGKYSAAEQIREIGFCRNKLKNIFKEHENLLRSKAKLSRYSGVLAGAFLSILFA